jgi:hypothetical protein
MIESHCECFDCTHWPSPMHTTWCVRCVLRRSGNDQTPNPGASGRPPAVSGAHTELEAVLMNRVMVASGLLLVSVRSRTTAARYVSWRAAAGYFFLWVTNEHARQERQHVHLSPLCMHVVHCFFPSPFFCIYFFVSIAAELVRYFFLHELCLI